MVSVGWTGQEGEREVRRPHTLSAGPPRSVVHDSRGATALTTVNVGALSNAIAVAIQQATVSRDSGQSLALQSPATSSGSTAVTHSST